MAFIGNTNTTQGFIPAIDYFSGNGSSVAFTLSRPVASVYQFIVAIDNVIQNPSSAYSVSGTTITFTSAPLAGTNNIWVEYTSPITQTIAPGQGTVTTSSLASSTGSGAVVLQTSPTITTPTISSPTITSQATFSAGTSALPAITTTGDTNTGMFFPAADTIAFAEGGTEAMRLDSAGNVGIGTASPQSKTSFAAASANYLTFQNSAGSSIYAAIGVDSGAPELVTGASANDTVIRTNQQLWFALSGGQAVGRFDSSANFRFNSGYGSAATAYGCRAWVNFNGTGVVAIRGSGNVSSITDNGTGDYTVNFTNALVDANYSIASSMGEGASGGNSVLQLYTPVAGSFRFTSRSSSANGFQDSVNCCVAVFR